MILCGVDRSEEAAQAAWFAADLAVRIGTGLTLVHVAPRPYVSPRLPDYQELQQEQMAFERAGYLGTVVKPLRVNAAASVARLVEFGRPVEVLRALAEELGATHLVTGTRGQGAVAEVLLASTSGPLARDAPCPVILVPGEIASRQDPHDGAIVCGVDGSDNSRAAARGAAELARLLNAQLVLATVTEPADDEVPASLFDDIRSTAPDVRIDVETLSGEPADELLALAQKLDALLAVVGSRGRNVIQAAVLGSVSGRLVEKTDRPVMVVSTTSTSSAG